MKRLALLGGGGHGKVVADIAQAIGWGAIEFYDVAWPQRTQNGHWPIVGATPDLIPKLSEYEGVAVSIGNCSIRWRAHQELVAAGARIVSVAHPSAIVSAFSEIGIGSVLMPGAIVNVDSVVGQACIINTAASVDHDCRLEDGVHICPSARLSGNVQVGTGSWIGVGASVKQGVVIGRHVTVGAGAVVLEAIPDGQIWVGNPARQLKQN